MKRMRDGRIKFATYRKSAYELLLDPLIFSYLDEFAIPVTYSFSVSHVLDLFVALSTRSCPQLAISHLYDHVGTSGEIIDDSGVIMRVDPNNPNEAVVKFPGQPEYRENAILTNSFPASYSCTTLLPVLTNNRTVASRVYQVAQSLYIIRPR